MRVKVLKVWPDTKQTKKGTIWGAQCTWEGHEDVRVSFFFQPQVGEYEVPKVEPRQYEGKEYYSIRQGQLASEPATPAPQQATSRPAAPKLPIMDELRAIAQIVKTLGEACPMESTTLNTILMEEFKRRGIERMAAYQHEEGAGGGASSSGPDGEMPDDSTIPF